jgi:transposase
LSPTQVSIAAGLPRTTVRRYLERAADAGLSWPLPAELDDHQLEILFFGRPAPAQVAKRHPTPDWEEVHRELRRPGVTLQLLWMEYKERCFLDVSFPLEGRPFSRSAHRRIDHRRTPTQGVPRVSTFRTDEMRPGRVPSILRGHGACINAATGVDHS